MAKPTKAQRDAAKLAGFDPDKMTKDGQEMTSESMLHDLLFQADFAGTTGDTEGVNDYLRQVAVLRQLLTKVKDLEADRDFYQATRADIISAACRGGATKPVRDAIDAAMAGRPKQLPPTDASVVAHAIRILDRVQAYRALGDYQDGLGLDIRSFITTYRPQE